MQQPRLAGLQNAGSNRSSTSLITPALTALSDPTQSKVDAHLFEFLAAEAIKSLMLSEKVSRSRRLAHEELVEAESGTSTGATKEKTPAPGSKISAEKQKEKERLEKEEADEGVRKRLDSMGFKVGWSLCEQLARDRPRFPPGGDALELVKFICKDIWITLYDKQIDNLRTNHRGVYVMVDNSFKPISRMSGVTGDEETVRRTKFFLAFPSGIIRGALANLGISCTVTAESVAVPQCTFQIKTIKPGAV